jgi:hypothetical protein
MSEDRSDDIYGERRRRRTAAAAAGAVCMSE